MSLLLIITFILGYTLIVFEHKLHVDKAAPALMTGVLCWSVLALGSSDVHEVEHHLLAHFGEIGAILFFLLGAMTIVELVALHNGFQVIVDKIVTRNKRKLLILVSIVTFFLSALLDNLTTAIVMATLIGKIVPEKQDRLLFAGMIVLAANAGGAWSPLGDVTTTMLWIGNQISAMGIIKALLLPSLMSLVVPLLLILPRLQGDYPPMHRNADNQLFSVSERNIVFYSGISLLLFVPVFKTVTHLPPFMGMLLSVSIIWFISEWLHIKKAHESKRYFSIFTALEKVDTPSILFFLGILLAVGALQASSLLSQMAKYLTDTVGNDTIILTLIGFLSSIFDNVPLVAAVQGMFELSQYPTDHFFWKYLAFTAGTGGSMLIIGSAAGVAIMGIEKIEFFWYLKHMAFLALAGFLAGAATYVGLHQLTGW